jgi:hypothetical protein
MLDLQENNETTVRLTIAKEVSLGNMDTRYVALSYCWGDTSVHPPLKTTTGNISDHIRGIRTKDIPRTILDAIAVTKAMGLRYLWVDALCIIQDDEYDWQNESVRMFQVYENAYFTIAAARGSNSYSGFLEPRINPTSVTIAFQSTFDRNVTGEYQLSPAHFPYHMELYSKEARYQLDVETSDWQSRGWTFQEEMASRRSIIFSERMYYHCQQSLKAEFTELTPRANSANSCLYKSLRSLSSEAAVYAFWYELVSSYMLRNLTFLEDRFPAISGIARQVANACGDHYYAGLWRNDLITGLLWRCNEDSCSASGLLSRCSDGSCNVLRYGIQGTYLAPSWSWANCGEAVNWTTATPKPRILEQCVINNIQTAVIGENPMGRVSSGHLTLWGKVERLTVGPHWSSLTVFPRDLWIVVDTDADVCAILLRRQDLSNSSSSLMEGLVLEKNGEADDYTRIGSFWIRDDSKEYFSDDCNIETVKIV